MHEAVLAYVGRWSTDDAVDVVDIGGRDLNGSCRHLFPDASSYTVVDVAAAPDVDVVADASGWLPATPVDMVLCTEVLEHTPLWPRIVSNIYWMLRPGGRLVLTCAGPGRHPHSGRTAGPIEADEFYANVAPDELRHALVLAGFTDVEVAAVGYDVQATAVRRG